jgi:ketosteroid isomerase-like protein
VEIVRQPVAVADRSRRRLAEHLVRFPHATAFFAGAIWRLYLLLPPRSRLRQAIIRRMVESGFEALNRRDFEAAFALYHPAGESIWPPQLVALGFEPVTRGREARVDAHMRWEAEWGEWRIEPDELIDLSGGRLLVTTLTKGSGVSSGATVDMFGAFLVTISAGQIIREQMYTNRAEALEAVGLSE